jgi:hypothetical protein
MATKPTVKKPVIKKPANVVSKKNVVARSLPPSKPDKTIYVQDACHQCGNCAGSS